MRKSRGPKIFPCGTPECTGSKLDEKTSILTKCILFGRYTFTHDHKGPVIPKSHCYTVAFDVELNQRLWKN